MPVVVVLDSSLCQVLSSSGVDCNPFPLIAPTEWFETLSFASTTYSKHGHVPSMMAIGLTQSTNSLFNRFAINRLLQTYFHYANAHNALSISSPFQVREGSLSWGRRERWRVNTTVSALARCCFWTTLRVCTYAPDCASSVLARRAQPFILTWCMFCSSYHFGFSSASADTNLYFRLITELVRLYRSSLAHLPLVVGVHACDLGRLHYSIIPFLIFLTRFYVFWFQLLATV